MTTEGKILTCITSTKEFKNVIAFHLSLWTTNCDAT